MVLSPAAACGDRKSVPQTTSKSNSKPRAKLKGLSPPFPAQENQEKQGNHGLLNLDFTLHLLLRACHQLSARSFTQWGVHALLKWKLPGAETLTATDFEI